MCAVAATNLLLPLLLLPLSLLLVLLLSLLLLLPPLLSLQLPLPLPMVHGDEEGVISEQTWGVDKIRASRFVMHHGQLGSHS